MHVSDMRAAGSRLLAGPRQDATHGIVVVAALRAVVRSIEDAAVMGLENPWSCDDRRRAALTRHVNDAVDVTRHAVSTLHAWLQIAGDPVQAQWAADALRLALQYQQQLMRTGLLDPHACEGYGPLLSSACADERVPADVRRLAAEIAQFIAHMPGDC